MRDSELRGITSLGGHFRFIFLFFCSGGGEREEASEVGEGGELVYIMRKEGGLIRGGGGGVAQGPERVCKEGEGNFFRGRSSHQDP